MGKEDLFSKLNIKDYNNQLENILERKTFSEGTKNILLNILYKMETSFDDYNKIKVYTKSKKELIEETIAVIENYCNDIEFVKPKLNDETKLGDKKYIIQNDKNKIISFPNEKAVFYALYHLVENKYKINDKYYVIKESMEKLLNKGYIIDKQEILRDFDGWTWNIVPSEIEDFVYNLIYQDIKILLGDKFLQESINNINNSDFVYEFEEKIKTSYNNKELAQNIITLIYQISILKNIKDDKKKQVDIFNLKEQLEKELTLVDNKKEYLQGILIKKRDIEKQIRDIDEKLNDYKLLRESFIKENAKLQEKIFSLSDYVEIIQSRRKELLIKLDECSYIMKPMNYIKTKEELEVKVKILSKLEKNEDMNKTMISLIIDLQKCVMKAFADNVKNIENKKEFINYVYLMRYYKLLYINEQEQLKDIDELKGEIRKTEKYLITKACKLKAINILCSDIERNYEIISSILSYNIIELQTVAVEFKKENKKIVLTIYDDNVVEDSITLEENEEINVKFNKKIKLFN